jgi:hypothetical protein
MRRGDGVLASRQLRSWGSLEEWGWTMGRKPSRSISVVALTLVVGLVVGMSPVGAHVNRRMGHVFRHVKVKIDREIISEFGDEDSNSPKIALPTCPDDKVVLGGGVSIGGASDPPEVAITASYPVESVDSAGEPIRGWFGRAAETDPTNEEWSFGAYVICANL